MKLRKCALYSSVFALLSLGACQEPQTIVTPVPYQAMLHNVRDGNLAVSQGEERTVTGLGREWADYALQVGLSPTVNGDYNPQHSGNLGDIPVLPGPGHMQEVLSSGGVQAYAQSWIRQNAITGYHSIFVELDLRKGATVSRIREFIDLNTNDQSKGGRIAFRKTVQLDGKLYALVIRIMPGPGLISKWEYEEGSGMVQDGSSSDSWGTTMPYERAGSLSDVTGGVVGGGGLKDPTFHDPIRPNEGGFGHLVD